MPHNWRRPLHSAPNSISDWKEPTQSTFWTSKPAMVYPPQNHLKIPPARIAAPAKAAETPVIRLLLSSAVAGSRMRAVMASAQTTLARITTQSIVPPAEILTVRLAVFEAKRPDVVTTESVVA